MELLSATKNTVQTVSVAVLSFCLSGCVYLVVGGVGAVGGYVVSPDTVEGITNNDTLTVFDAAEEIVSVMGVIEESYEAGGTLISKISGTKVTITITSVGASSSRVTVKARKFYLPRISVAQDIFVKIMSYLNE